MKDLEVKLRQKDDHLSLNAADSSGFPTEV